VHRLPRALLAALATACALTLPGAAQSASCGSSGYSYAGVMGSMGVAGVAATISTTEGQSVQSGHVGGWVGVGGSGLGAGGRDAWIQIGLAAFPGSRTSSVYYEVTEPGKEPRYTELLAGVGPDEAHRVAVSELRDRPGWWRAWLDGRPASPAIHLPGSHGRWAPVVIGESWDGGDAVCNRFGYRFRRMRALAHADARWAPIASAFAVEDAGYEVAARTTTGFVARVIN
jgi:hypothetical protein